MSLLISKPGILTTVQDLGRNGFRRFGINQSGAMDRIAFRLINSLLGNDETEAVLEMHFPAPEILFEEPAVCALGGADFSAILNGEPVENWRLFLAPKGSLLKFGQRSSGNRAYLAVKGGFGVVPWLKSTSTNLPARIGGFDGRKLRPGDRIPFKRPITGRPPRFIQKISNSMIPFYSKFPTVRVVAGAEFDDLTAVSRRNFLNENFTISRNSDRMGFRLIGEPLHLIQNKELVSSAVSFGTIQRLPDGQLITLMADHQTSGGYPRLANIISTDLPLIAQLGANDQVAFHLISIGDAESLLIDFENNLNKLKIAGKYR
jgi:antagonist of KipI